MKEMPAKRQHADICTWLSAKYSLFSVIYFRFYEALTIAGLGEQRRIVYVISMHKRFISTGRHTIDCNH